MAVRRVKALALVALLQLTAWCHGDDVDRMGDLLDVPAIDGTDPVHVEIGTAVWCARAVDLVDAVGFEALEGWSGQLPVCAPAGWVDLGHGIYGPEHLVRIRRCESTDRYDNVSRSGRYRGAYQFDQPTWDEQARLSGRPDLVGADPAAAAPADQDLLAVDLYQRRGPRPWPRCGAPR